MRNVLITITNRVHNFIIRENKNSYSANERRILVKKMTLPTTTKAYLQIRDNLRSIGRRVQKFLTQCIGFHTYEPTEYENIKIEMKNIRKC